MQNLKNRHSSEKPMVFRLIEVIINHLYIHGDIKDEDVLSAITEI